MPDKSLEQVLDELKQAEKEFKEKCLKYGIQEPRKKRKEGEDEVNQEVTTSEDENKESSEN